MYSPPRKAWAAWRRCAPGRWRSPTCSSSWWKSAAQATAWALATPREHAQRGSQVCLTRDEGAGVNGQGSGGYAIVQALIARGVIGDFAPVSAARR